MKGKKREVSSRIYEYNFAKLAKRISHARERMRYLAFAYMQEGKTNTEISKLFKINKMTVRRKNYDPSFITRLDYTCVCRP